MHYCIHCGHALQERQRFCTACGLAAVLENATPNAPPMPPQPDLRYDAAPPPEEKKSHTMLVAVLGVLFGLIAAGIGGLVYAGSKVKQKAVAYFHPQQSVESTKPAPPLGVDANSHSPDANTNKIDEDDAVNIVGGLLNKLGGSRQQQSNPFDNLKFVAKSDYDSIRCPAPPAGAELHSIPDARIPFVPGLKLTTAWGRTPGDVEVLNTVAEIRADAYRLTTGGLTFANDTDIKGKQETNVRDICASDWKNSMGYVTEDGAFLPPIAPDTTQGVLSAAAFNELKNTGKFTAKYLLYFQAGDRSGVREHWREGTLTRVGSFDVDYPVIVNNDAVKLPTILARGTMLATDKAIQADTANINNRPTPVEIQVLDDPMNPLVLNYSFTNQPFRIQVVKIEYPTNEKKIEQALAKKKKAVVYGIYFDFNSDEIKPESKPVMDEIATALKDHPDWNLTVDGYTDNIGGDGYNLDLSKRRSASVKETLVTQYRVAPTRLMTNGYGNSSPIDTNDTLEGRARNRRVELTRQ